MIMNARRLGIPPATALLMAAMSLASSGLLVSQFPPPVPPSSSLASLICNACLSSLYHKDVFHLIINLSWGLFTFKRLEEHLGSKNFLLTTLSLTFLLKMATLVMGLLFPDMSFKKGFSGVLFSLHSLLIIRNPQAIQNHPLGTSENSQLFSLLFALVLIALLQAFTLQDALFSDNFGGIVIGFLYSKILPHVKSLLAHTLTRCNEFLSQLMSTSHRPQPSTIRNQPRPRNVPFTSHYQYDGNRDPPPEGPSDSEIDDNLEWQCDTCDRKNGVYYVVCEACAHPRTWKTS